MAQKELGGRPRKAKSPPPAAGKQANQPGAKKVIGRRRNRLSMVRMLIDKWSTELGAKPQKSGVAELVRLLTLEKEMSANREMIREIRVTWVEPKRTESPKSE